MLCEHPVWESAWCLNWAFKRGCMAMVPLLTTFRRRELSRSRGCSVSPKWRQTGDRLVPKGCPAPCPLLRAPHVDREKVPLARGRHPEQEPQALYSQPLTRSYQQHYPTWPAMLQSCATIPAGSRLPLPAAAKPLSHSPCLQLSCAHTSQ